MIIDIIIVACSKNDGLKKMTQDAISSCINSENEHLFNIIIVETFNQNIKYDNARVVYFVNDSFNYNKSLNFGLKYCKNKYICFCNNDLLFHKNWASNLIEAMKKNKALSGSPFCPLSFKKSNKDVNIGYKIREQIAGWCIMIDKKVLSIIGKLNEGVDFWYSDNIYSDQLKNENIKHLLVYNSVVTHLENKTLNTLSRNNKIKITSSQKSIYDKITHDKYTFSIIMPSFLGDYQYAAKNRKEKMKRAIDSVLAQNFKDYELIIVADGCNDTVNLYREYSKNKNIKCLLIEKQNLFAGVVRQKGIDYAKGKYIIYLDNDDFYGENHLQNIANEIKTNDWCYFDDILYALRNDTKKVEATKKITKLLYGVAGTSSICHKRNLNVSWDGMDGYGHDWYFIKQLLKYKKHKKVTGGEYYICHQPNMFDS